jgi:hypothetical protein
VHKRKGFRVSPWRVVQRAVTAGTPSTPAPTEPAAAAAAAAAAVAAAAAGLGEGQGAANTLAVGELGDAAGVGQVVQRSVSAGAGHPAPVVAAPAAAPAEAAEAAPVGLGLAGHSPGSRFGVSPLCALVLYQAGYIPTCSDDQQTLQVCTRVCHDSSQRRQQRRMGTGRGGRGPWLVAGAYSRPLFSST